jgi:hypothetical protein
MLKSIAVLLAGLTFAGSVYASCTTHTYFINGRMVSCTTCCFGGSCTTNCF